MEDTFSLAQAFTPGEPAPHQHPFGPFRGQGTAADAPEGALTKKYTSFHASQVHALAT